MIRIWDRIRKAYKRWRWGWRGPFFTPEGLWAMKANRRREEHLRRVEERSSRRRITIEVSEEDVRILRSVQGLYGIVGNAPSLKPNGAHDRVAEIHDLASRIEAALREEPPTESD